MQIWDLPVRKPALQGECFPKIRIFLRKHHHNRMKAKGNQIESPLIWLHDRKISSQCRPPFSWKRSMTLVKFDDSLVDRTRSVHQRCLTHLFMLQAVCRPYVYRNRTSNDEGLICVLTYYVGKAPKKIFQIWCTLSRLGESEVGLQKFLLEFVVLISETLEIYLSDGNVNFSAFHFPMAE